MDAHFQLTSPVIKVDSNSFEFLSLNVAQQSFFTLFTGNSLIFCFLQEDDLIHLVKEQH